MNGAAACVLVCLTCNRPVEGVICPAEVPDVSRVLDTSRDEHAVAAGHPVQFLGIVRVDPFVLRRIGVRPC